MRNLNELFKGYIARPARDDVGAEPLAHHIEEVANLCEFYAKKFGMGELGRQIGLLHDLGKRTKRFQDVLARKADHINHSIAGAIVLRELGDYSRINSVVASCVNSHHTKLDYIRDLEEFDVDGSSNYTPSFTDEEIEELVEIAKELKIEGIDGTLFNTRNQNAKMFMDRMLFSALVDADWTSSANWYNKDYDSQTTSTRKTWDELLANLENYRNNILAHSDVNSPINILRGEIYENCSRKGKTHSGLNTLTAPTGLGKTLALFKFALENAKTLNKDRIIIVLPYLSIIDQNAQVYKDICGDGVVFEFDSQVDYTDRENREELREIIERWNSQVIVTTSVRFFNTMFDNRPKALRGLHNYANSVVVFDECQTLPNDLIETSLGAINTLVKYCNTTMLFSSATQPSYQYRKNVEWTPVELTDDVETIYELYNEIKKTKVKWDTETVYNYNSLHKKFEGENQVLYVFNTVKRAREFYDYLLTKGYEDEELYILTSRMCGEHKLKTIDTIKNRIKNGLTTIVVSTQCIEAGVDLDFPYGARAFAPFDSIVQTAGRINRNGKNDGYLLVFNLENSGNSLYEYPDESYKISADIARKLPSVNHEMNLNDLRIMDRYYNELYHSNNSNQDRPDLVKAINKDFDFSAVQEHYSFIDVFNQYNIITTYNREKFDEINSKLINTDNGRVITKEIMRLSAPYTIHMYATKKNSRNISSHCERLYLQTKSGELVETNYFILTSGMYYSEKTGIEITELENSMFL